MNVLMNMEWRILLNIYCLKGLKSVAPDILLIASKTLVVS